MRFTSKRQLGNMFTEMMDLTCNWLVDSKATPKLCRKLITTFLNSFSQTKLKKCTIKANFIILLHFNKKWIFYNHLPLFAVHLLKRTVGRKKKSWGVAWAFMAIPQSRSTKTAHEKLTSKMFKWTRFICWSVKMSPSGSKTLLSLQWTNNLNLTYLQRLNGTNLGTRILLKWTLTQSRCQKLFGSQWKLKILIEPAI